MYYIYILYSESSDLFYVGYTNNYERRKIEHNESDLNTFTAKHRPWIMKAVFECGNNKNEAMRIEKFIKKQKSKLFLQKLINNKNIQLADELAQLVRVPNISG